MKQKFAMPDGEILEKEFPAFKTPWNHDTEFESRRTSIYFNEPSLTKQEFKEEADINTILNRFLKTGEPPALALPEHFVDMTNRTSYFEYASAAAEANKLFYLLPAGIRSEFLNDPARWADAVVRATEAGDVDRLVKMGIQVPESPQEPEGGDPPAPGTPAAQTASKAPGEPKKGGEPPQPGPGPDNPPSDNGKK